MIPCKVLCGAFFLDESYNNTAINTCRIGLVYDDAKVKKKKKIIAVRITQKTSQTGCIDSSESTIYDKN